MVRSARAIRRMGTAVLCALLLALTGCSFSTSGADAALAAKDAFASLSDVESDQAKEDPSLITAQNNQLFVDMLQADSPSDAEVTSFVDKYQGRTVEFDATVSAVSDDSSAPGERTWNDIELVTGDNVQRSCGPVFVLRNINVSKTGLSDIAPGQKVDLIATINSFDADKGQVVLGLVSISTRS